MRDLTVPERLGISDECELTREQLQRVMPKQTKAKITPQLVKSINDVMVDPQLRENFRDNLLSYTNVMADGRYKIQSYIDAVKYVSYKLLGATNIEAYTKTFPHRFKRLIDEQAEPKTIASYSTAYNKTQLVNKIMEQTLVPMHILNQDLYQKALNQSAYLMMHANSEKVQADAANNLMTQLKMPETSKIELDVTLKEDDSIAQLRNATLKLAGEQLLAITSGSKTTQEVAHSDLVIEHQGDTDE